MTPNEQDQDPHDVPGFDRALGIDDTVPESEYGDQGYHPEQDITDANRGLVDDLHEALLNVRNDLQQLDEHLPEPLSLTDSIREINAIAEAYARLGSDYHDNLS